MGLVNELFMFKKCVKESFAVSVRNTVIDPRFFFKFQIASVPTTALNG